MPPRRPTQAASQSGPSNPNRKGSTAICLCIYHGCKNATFTNRTTGEVHPGREVSRQTLSNHRKKDQKWAALQNATPSAGTGPHSVLQDVAGIIPERAPSPSITLPSESGSDATIAMAVDEASAPSIGPWILPAFPDTPSISTLQTAIQSLVDILAVWLYALCGLSRQSTICVLKVLHNIIILAIQVGYLSSQTDLPLRPGGAYFTTPFDVRTAITHLSIEPTLPENVFIAGITPAPHEPDVISITHLLDPIVDQFLDMWNGSIIRTYLHPQGIFYRVAVLPGIGDMPAMRKAFGRAGVGSNRHMCSLCQISKDNIDDIDTIFPPHVGEDILLASTRWKESALRKERDMIFAEAGVRWSPLLRLTYRDPVKHTIVGAMHNWIEGVLQHHVRVYWSIGVPAGVASTRAKAKQQSNQSGASIALPDTPTVTTLSIDEHGYAMDVDDDGNSDSGSQRTYSTDTVDGTESEGDFGQGDTDDLEDEEPAPRATQTFTQSQLDAIRCCIADVVIPSWIDRPPSNLGEASHGKLKADEWLTLITIFLPMILPEIWYESAYHTLLQNFAYLVTCTNVVCSYTVSPFFANLYTNHYVAYRKSSLALFPECKSRPNHHFAMHNGELMQYWGPLILLSEFTGERFNGILQKTKTNGRLRMFLFAKLIIYTTPLMP
ncbi:hypothetical protein CVT24_007928 [Panaeolus cyanescens]|uniref:Uncharacterized protein n=1 Tax=Panaeolus cyanescens TaxID=181874 RepID=A0A409WD04_9AGAR|nr:hypothetical protein CVT24_007928 [Panaeolus cyanescens]